MVGGETSTRVDYRWLIWQAARDFKVDFVLLPWCASVAMAYENIFLLSNHGYPMSSCPVDVPSLALLGLLQYGHDAYDLRLFKDFNICDEMLVELLEMSLVRTISDPRLWAMSEGGKSPCALLILVQFVQFNACLCQLVFYFFTWHLTCWCTPKL